MEKDKDIHSTPPSEYVQDIWPQQVTAAEKSQRAKQTATRLQTDGLDLEPVRATTRGVASSFWGKAWCQNLDRYSDYDGRLPRGRTYLRSGCVIDLKIQPERIEAKVQGDYLYEIVIRLSKLEADQWQILRDDCRNQIDSVLDLLQGRLSDSVMEVVINPNRGLFPQYSEIKFSCTCLDFADMCKHVAAVLYGVGVRLDTQPELLFRLRGVDHFELVTTAATSGLEKNVGVAEDEILGTQDLGRLFGIDLEDE
jgi:uncharacterized Zn finger protein